jgi:3-methylcrotonyl-CoA carboxylase alpha subunit
MIKKILIANRGEIACRVIQSAKKMGIRTVAVFSDADALSKHVELANEAVHIGPSAVAESYLKGDKIIEAAQKTGAQAIHPGYGFLSENPNFVESVEQAGLIFVGPSSNAIKAMGLKDAAKALMEKAGVPVVPGYHGDSQDIDYLAGEAEKIGYPVLIKARAGGGGKGMRLVEKPEDFKTAFESAAREGLSSFGDPACLIEKYITQPRHIEIQVFGDSHGNVVHFFERDCSLQRRHQKVIEEAPAPGMPEKVRAAMGKAAVEAAKAISYEGAGTVEFIVDGSNGLREDGFWFMEMNTRLQVEHPVSEAITGYDFVELQLRVACGEKLPMTQDDLAITGHSFEARVYAEDVPKGFLPATGTLQYLKFPKGSEFELGSVRIDSGVRGGDEISPWYDPMIAKVIVHGPTRSSALNMLSQALDDCHIVGSVTNLDFLSALANHKGFYNGDVDTGLIERDQDQLTVQLKAPLKSVAMAALGGLGLLNEKISNEPWERLVGWCHWTDAKQYVVLEQEDTRLEVAVSVLGKGHFCVHIEDDTLNIKTKAQGDNRFKVFCDDVQSQLDVVVRANCVAVFGEEGTFSFDLPNALASFENEQAGGDSIIAPMPGLVKVVMAKAGDTVKEGDPLFILEAMKMEHTLCAPRDGLISEVLAAQDAQVTDGMVLLSLEKEDD